MQHTAWATSALSLFRAGRRFGSAGIRFRRNRQSDGRNRRIISAVEGEEGRMSSRWGWSAGEAVNRLLREPTKSARYNLPNIPVRVDREWGLIQF